MRLTLRGLVLDCINYGVVPVPESRRIQLDAVRNKAPTDINAA